MFEGFKNFVGKFQSQKILKKNVVIDCACGVGSLTCREFLDLGMKEIGNFSMINESDPESLNSGCGSDFIHTKNDFPKNYDFGDDTIGGTFDGDADRSFVYGKVDGKFRIAEGTRVSAVMAQALKQLIDDLQSAAAAAGETDISEEIKKWTMGVVYTPYSIFNGVDYIKSLGFETIMAKTGIKYVDKAARNFNFGIYFESNGHGDICFDIQFVREWYKRFETVENQEFKDALFMLYNYLCIVNDTDGDALANIFVFLASAIKLDQTFEDILGYYDDGFNTTLAAKVRDRYDVVTTADEVTCVKPEGL